MWCAKWNRIESNRIRLEIFVMHENFISSLDKMQINGSRYVYSQCVIDICSFLSSKCSSSSILQLLLFVYHIISDFLYSMAFSCLCSVFASIRFHYVQHISMHKSIVSSSSNNNQQTRYLKIISWLGNFTIFANWRIVPNQSARLSIGLRKIKRRMWEFITTTQIESCFCKHLWCCDVVAKCDNNKINKQINGIDGDFSWHKEIVMIHAQLDRK